MRFLLRYGLWIVTGVLALAMLLEYGGGLTLYHRLRYGEASAEEERRSLIQEQYRLIGLDLDPFAFFRLPVASTEFFHIDANGFRGPGPDAKDDRKLAFLIGGSTAFGWHATADEATITARLNTLQKKYFFVNAAVPSFNTTQEMARLSNELLVFRPALVISLSGANDLFDARLYKLLKRDYPLGAPENFAELDDLSHGGSLPKPGIIRRYFPELTRHTVNLLTAPFKTHQEPQSVNMDGLATAVAEKYAMNAKMMDLLTRGYGGNFVAIIQPMRTTAPEYPMYQEFRSSVPQLDAVTVSDDVLTDSVHLSDEGNAVIAKQILGVLAKHHLQ